MRHPHLRRLRPLRIVLSIILGALPALAGAQSLPKPAEFYFDADASAMRPLVAVRDTGDAAVQKLMKAIERKPADGIEERAQLARIAMDGGRVELGRRLYAEALQRIDRNHALWRAVTWNYAWDLHRSGDAEGAFAQWRSLLLARGTTATWMPTTFAMSLWTLGRREEAVQWYAAAVRSEPQQWSSTARYAELLPGWMETERATLAEVQAAWAANPPPYP